MARQCQTVYGHTIPAPRVTYRAVGLGFVYVGLPILGATFLLDLAVWAIGRTTFDVCVGVWCGWS